MKKIDKKQFMKKMKHIELMNDVPMHIGVPPSMPSNWAYLKQKKLNQEHFHEHVHNMVYHFSEDFMGETHHWGKCSICNYEED